MEFLLVVLPFNWIEKFDRKIGLYDFCTIQKNYFEIFEAILEKIVFRKLENFRENI